MSKYNKTFPKKGTLSKLALAIMCINTSLSTAGPGNYSISDGAADISGIGTATTTIDQTGISTADTVVIEWDSFNVNSGESVNFIQDSGDIAINNINASSGVSDIQGSITAGGTIFLSNSNGFIFGTDSVVNTGAFLATTSNIDFDSSKQEIGLSDNASTGSIEIDTGASINANESESGGYLAFISKDISSSGSTNANNGEVLFSNDINSTIKLAGLNINFPSSSFSGTTSNSIDLSNSDITASTLILTSHNLTDLLDSVIKQPDSLSIENIALHGPEVTDNSDISGSIESTFEILEPSDNSNSVSISTDRFSTNNSINTNNTDVDQLSIYADEISITKNIFGSDLHLNLDAQDSVSISKFGSGFGGNEGFDALTISANAISTSSDLKSNNDLTLTGSTTITGSPTDSITDSIIEPLIQSENGDIFINGDLKTEFIHSSLLLSGNNIHTASITGFDSIEYSAANIYLSGNLNSNDITFNTGVNILLKEDVSMSAQAIEFDSSTFSSYSETDADAQYALKLIGTASGENASNRILLNGSTLSDLTPLKSITISSNDINADTKIFLGGKYNASSFCIHDCDTMDTAVNAYSLTLTSKTTLSDLQNLNLSESSLSGDFSFTALGNSVATNQASFNSISNLEGLHASGFNTITLHNNIETNEGGLSLLASNIKLNGAVNISNNDSGAINLGYSETAPHGTISSTSGTDSLMINSKNSVVSIGNINGIDSLTISKDLKNEGSTTLGGDIAVGDFVQFNNLGEITVDHTDNLNFSMEATDTISFIENDSLSITNLYSNNCDGECEISLTSNTLSLGELSAEDIQLNSELLTLYGDVTASGDLIITHNENAKSTVTVELENDISLAGNMNFLNAAANPINIIGKDQHLDITSSNGSIYMHTFDDYSTLESLSITTTDTSSDIDIFFETDADNNILLPNLSGSKGLSLLGNLTLDIGANQEINSSDYNGNLDFSGVHMTGSGFVTFNTGSGELSLGSFSGSSEDTPFTALNIHSTGKLNLHGELDIATESGFDFSSVNAIEIHTDLTLGSAEVPTKINFGEASINGTYSLTLYSSSLTIANIGNNIPLQNLNIFSSTEADAALTLSSEINVVGNVNIDAGALNLNSSITSSGENINISSEMDMTMHKDAIISAEYGNITMTSNTGNIGIGQLVAGNDVTVRSEQGYLYNNVNDYISNSSATKNIISTDQKLYGFSNIGESVSSPIVIDVQNGGTINAESNGNIYIANLANAQVNSSGRVIDGSSGGETASIDAFTQLKLASLHTVNLPSFSNSPELISNLTWQVDEEENIRKIKSPASAPAIYYSRYGWRLGQK